MGKIFKISDMMSEAMVTAQEVSKIDTIGMIKTTRSLNGIKRRSIVLYDFKSTLTLGFFDGYMHSSDGEWHQDHVYAMPGYGPLIHELFMCSIAPDYIIPSRTIRPKAIRVWALFSTLRSDIESEALKEDHEYLAHQIEYENGHPISDKHILDVINVKYKMKESSSVFNIYHALGTKGLSLMEEYKISAGAIIREAYAQFARTYKSETLVESTINLLPENWSLPGITREDAIIALTKKYTKFEDE